MFCGFHSLTWSDCAALEKPLHSTFKNTMASFKIYSMMLQYKPPKTRDAHLSLRNQNCTLIKFLIIIIQYTISHIVHHTLLSSCFAQNWRRGIDKAGGKQKGQWNIVCLCALENGFLRVQGTFGWVSVHEWTVILQVFQQAHLPPSSWHHLHIRIPDQNVDTSSLSRYLADKHSANTVRLRWETYCVIRMVPR